MNLVNFLKWGPHTPCVSELSVKSNVEAHCSVPDQGSSRKSNIDLMILEEEHSEHPLLSSFPSIYPKLSLESVSSLEKPKKKK